MRAASLTALVFGLLLGGQLSSAWAKPGYYKTGSGSGCGCGKHHEDKEGCNCDEPGSCCRKGYYRLTTSHKEDRERLRAVKAQRTELEKQAARDSVRRCSGCGSCGTCSKCHKSASRCNCRDIRETCQRDDMRCDCGQDRPNHKYNCECDKCEKAAKRCGCSKCMAPFKHDCGCSKSKCGCGKSKGKCGCGESKCGCSKCGGDYHAGHATEYNGRCGYAHCSGDENCGCDGCRGDRDEKYDRRRAAGTTFLRD
jgi:hypothetical protein